MRQGRVPAGSGPSCVAEVAIIGLPASHGFSAGTSTKSSSADSMLCTLLIHITCVYIGDGGFTYARVWDGGKERETPITGSHLREQSLGIWSLGF